MASCYPKSYKMEQYGSDIQERFSVASEESAPYVPLERSDFPAIFEALKSSEPDTWNESLNKLNLFLENQREFAIENPDVIDLPVIFEVANTTDDETLRSSLLETIGTFTSLSSVTLPKVIPFIPKLVTLIALGNSADLYHILSILEEVTGQHPSTEEDILQELTTLYAPVVSMDPEESDSSEARVVALIEAFENCLIFSRSTLIPIFTKANIIDAILASAFCKTTKIRAAAASCFARMTEHLDAINSNLPDETNRGNLMVFILSAFAQLVSDKDEEIAKTAANFIGEDRGEVNSLVRIVFADQLDAIKSLVLQVALKRPNTVGAPCEFAILRLIEEDGNDEPKKAVTTVFTNLWSDEEVSVETKLQIISGLNDSFADIRKVAIDSGLCDFVIKTSRQKADHTIPLLSLFDKCMDSEQLFGSVLIDIEGALPYFVDLFADDGISDIRKLAGSILAKTLDSYKDGESRRKDAATFLTSAVVYPRLLSTLKSADVEVVNAGLHLLGDILSGEPEFYFRDDDDPELPCPMKDIIVTKELVDQTIGLLKSPITAVEALYLLSQFTWEYKRGFELVKTAFETVVPTADVFFFESLYGTYTNRHAGRQKRVIADAALKAGGLERVLSLLEEDHPTVEARRASVEAVRVLLAADSADVGVGRKSSRLAQVVAMLIQDDTVESLKVARFMIRLVAYSLEDDPETNLLDAWKGKFTSETIQHLMKWANKGPEVVGGPTEGEEEEVDEETSEKRKKAIKEYEEVLSGVAEILKNLRSILKSFCSDIIPPIIQASVARDIYEPSDLLEFLRTYITKDEECVKPLVKSIQDVLSASQTPEFDKYYSWISSNPIMCSAFYQAGIIDYILKAYDNSPDESNKTGEEDEHPEEAKEATTEDEEDKDTSPQDEDGDEKDSDDDDGDEEKDSDDDDDVYADIIINSNEDETGHLPIKLLAHIAEHISDTDKLKQIQEAFIAHDKAVPHALRYISNQEAVYDAQEVARNVYFLTRDNQTCIDAIAKTDIYDVLLRLFSSEDVALDRIGGLVGLLAHTNVDKLTKALTSLMKGNSPHDRKEVIDLMQVLFDSSSAGKEAVLKAKPGKYLRKSLNVGEMDVQEVALVLLQALFLEGSSEVTDFIPLISNRVQKELDPLAKALEVLRPVLTDKNAAAISESGIISSLFKIAVESPGSVGDMDLVVGTLGDMASLEGCCDMIVSLIKDHSGSLEALEQEDTWGLSHLLRRWLEAGGPSLPTLIDAGGLDYALQLLRAEDLYHNVKGAVLVESFAYSDDLRSQVQPWLTQNQVPALIVQIQAKCLEESSQDVAKDLKEDETPEQFEGRIKLVKTWYGTVTTALKIVNGETVEGYAPDFWIVGRPSE